MTSHVLLFDLDGTLTDPKLGIVRCMRHALDRLALLSIENGSGRILSLRRFSA